MILEDFKEGWQKAFEERLNSLFKIFPGLSVKSTQRYHGMLRVELVALDSEAQYIVDCVTYRIERKSGTICEYCGGNGLRRVKFLPEKMCVCWKCYALTVDALEHRNIESVETGL